MAIGLSKGFDVKVKKSEKLKTIFGFLLEQLG